MLPHKPPLWLDRLRRDGGLVGSISKFSPFLFSSGFSPLDFKGLALADLKG